MASAEGRFFEASTATGQEAGRDGAVADPGQVDRLGPARGPGGPENDQPYDRRHRHRGRRRCLGGIGAEDQDRHEKKDERDSPFIPTGFPGWIRLSGANARRAAQGQQRPDDREAQENGGRPDFGEKHTGQDPGQRAPGPQMGVSNRLFRAGDMTDPIIVVDRLSLVPEDWAGDHRRREGGKDQVRTAPSPIAPRHQAQRQADEDKREIDAGQSPGQELRADGASERERPGHRPKLGAGHGEAERDPIEAGGQPIQAEVDQRSGAARPRTSQRQQQARRDPAKGG